MPSVARTTMKKPPKPNPSGGVLSRIVPVSSLTKGVKILVYGRGKTGKTRLFSTFPKPCLLIGTEDGTNSVANVEDIDFVFLQASSEIDEIAKMLRSGKYASVGLDTAGGLQEIILKEILGLDELPVQKSWGLASQQQWGICNSQLKERLRKLLDLADQSIVDVMVIAHERNFSDDDKSDMLTPTVGAALSPSAAGWLNGAVDLICQTLIREETAEVKSKVAGKVITQTKKTGKCEYALRIGPHPVYITGFRCKVDGNDLPDYIVNPTYDKIVSTLNGD